MKRPRKLEFAGQTAKIKYYRKQLHKEDLDGFCDYDNKIIYIKMGQKESQFQDTLLHESLHFISMMYNLSLTEKQIHTLTVALLALVKNNNLNILE